jgi:hypothetical protein
MPGRDSPVSPALVFPLVETSLACHVKSGPWSGRHSRRETSISPSTLCNVSAFLNQGQRPTAAPRLSRYDRTQTDKSGRQSLLQASTASVCFFPLGRLTGFSLFPSHPSETLNLSDPPSERKAGLSREPAMNHSSHRNIASNLVIPEPAGRTHARPWPAQGNSEAEPGPGCGSSLVYPPAKATPRLRLGASPT